MAFNDDGWIPEWLRIYPGTSDYRTVLHRDYRLQHRIRNYVIGGSRSCGKTYPITRGLALALSKYPGTRLGIVRRTKQASKDGTLNRIRWQIRDLNLPANTPRQGSHIDYANGSSIISIGVESSQQELRGIEGVNVLLYDEAQFVEEFAISELSVTLKEQNSFSIFLYNPTLATDYVDRMFYSGEPSTWTPGRLLTMADNAYWNDTLELERERYEREHSAPMYAHTYLGEYAPTTGGVFDVSQIRIGVADRPQTTIRTVDLAYSESPAADRTVIMRLSRQGDDCYGSDIRGVRWGVNRVFDLIGELAALDGPMTEWVVEEQPGGAGLMVQDMWNNSLPNYHVLWQPTGGRSKLQRAIPAAMLMSRGRLYLDRHYPEAESEWAAFTGTTADRHDDYVDALAHGVNYLFGAGVV